MSRQFTVHDKAWGELTFFVVRTDYAGVFEDPWEGLRQYEETAHYLDLFNEVSGVAYRAALTGSPLSLLREIVFAPDACLSRVSPQHRVCHSASTCLTYQAQKCLATYKAPPICYEFGLTEPLELRILCTRLTEMWRSGVYTIRIKE